MCLAIKELARNIVHSTYSPIPLHFSNNLRELVAEMLTKDPKLRPSIKTLLQKEFLSVFLSLISNLTLNRKE